MRSMLLAVCVAGSVAMGAGPLDPPVGPVDPTMRTLREVEPRIPLNPSGDNPEAPGLVINSPGSYFLTGNIVGTSGSNGIEIRSSHVTLDLSGFAVLGVAGSLDGIVVAGGTRLNVSVFNGTVRGWGDDGIDAAGAINASFADLRLNSNGGAGLVVRQGVVKCSVARGNGTHGIDAGDGSVVMDSTSLSNQGLGFRIGTGAVISRCAAMLNASSGIGTGHACVVESCYARQNQTGGIVTAEQCTVYASSAMENGFVGFSSTEGGSFSGCTAKANTTSGFQVGPGGVVSGCSSDENQQTGFILNPGSRAVDCTARANATSGFAAADATMEGCEARGGQMGFVAEGRSVVRRCTARANTDGFDIIGPGALIDECFAEGNSVNGFDVGGTGNLLRRNAVRGNPTGYAIGAGNASAQIIDHTAGAIGFQSNQPWANFRY